MKFIIIGIIAGIIILIIIAIVLIFIISKKKLEYYTIRTAEAESNIDILFQEKIQILHKIIPIIRNKTKEKDFYKNFNDLKNKNFNYYELWNYLNKLYGEIIKTIDDYPKLTNDKGLVKLLFDLESTEENLRAAGRFFNDNSDVYNLMIGSFPVNIYAKFNKFVPNKLYSLDKIERFEIMKK